MAKTIWDYGVKYKYGYSKAYGPTFHTGEDWTVPDHKKDIPVVVNGVQIGITGTTGLSTGIHLHLGKWKYGTHHAPKGAGKSIPGGVVTQVDHEGNSNNGKFVRVRGSDGFDYVYLHLSKVTCKVGQKLRVKAPLPIPTRKFYKVKSGDTATSIARKHKITLSKFAKLNPRIANLNWLYVGQKVRVK